MDSLPRFAWSRMTLFKTSFLSRRTTDGIHTHHPGGVLRFSQLKSRTPVMDSLPRFAWSRMTHFVLADYLNTRFGAGALRDGKRLADRNFCRDGLRVVVQDMLRGFDNQRFL